MSVLRFRAFLLRSMLAVQLGMGTAWAVSMAVPFGSHMVLQRNVQVPIWGKGTSSESVTVTFNGQTKTATTGSDGKWRMLLDPMPAGGPYTLVAKGTGSVTYTDVMVGEVWQCAGQSNMDTRMNYSEYPSLADSIKKANVPQMRYITMRQPNQTIQWQVVTPTTAGSLSATGYFFGKDLVQHLDGVTVGLVVTAVGGTTVGEWLDPASVSADPVLKSDTTAGTMFDSWVAPVVGYAIAGTAWYQGENDCSSALYGYYTARLVTMVKAWRKLWGQGDFPFLVAQLAHTHAKQTVAGGTSNYGEVRESQRIVADSFANAWLEVNIDLGSTTTLHYDQKPIVGHRLGLLARGGIYKEAGLLNWRSPQPAAAWTSGSAVRILTSFTGGGLSTSDNAAPEGIAVAGSDGVWNWGTTAIHGDTLVVQSSAVSKPTQVRYAFSDFPIGNIAGGSGLPMTPFRYTVLGASGPATTAVGSVATPGPGWSVRGHRLVADLLAGRAAAMLETIGMDGRILSRSEAVPGGSGAEWDLGSASGIRLFRVLAEGHVVFRGKVVLP